MKRLQFRKSELSTVIKKGGTIRLIAFLHRALLDDDLIEGEKEQYIKTLNHLTARGTKLEPGDESKDENPFS